MSDDAPRARAHATCLVSGFCVEHYAGRTEKSCLGLGTPRLPGAYLPTREEHASCATSGFCAVHYAGFAKEPCRRSVVA